MHLATLFEAAKSVELSTIKDVSKLEKGATLQLKGAKVKFSKSKGFAAAIETASIKTKVEVLGEDFAIKSVTLERPDAGVYLASEKKIAFFYKKAGLDIGHLDAAEAVEKSYGEEFDEDQHMEDYEEAEREINEIGETPIKIVVLWDGVKAKAKELSDSEFTTCINKASAAKWVMRNKSDLGL